MIKNKKSLSLPQELELLASLEAHGAVPLKFAYLDQGFIKWIKIAQKSRASGGLEKLEDKILQKNLPFLFSELEKNKGQEFNIIDLGCGDGRPIGSVFSYLQAKRLIKNNQINYIPIDISSNMLYHATQYISQHYKVKTKPYLIDFEKGSFPEILISGNNKKSLNYCFFLGNTLGNFTDTGRILSNFKDSMFSTDYLIVGNELANLQAMQKIIRYYQDQAGYDFVVNTLKRYGYRDSDGTFHVRWNENKKQIEGYIKLKKDIKFKIAETNIKFEKNEEILLFISKKYVEDDLIKIFNEIGFRIHIFTTNQAKRYCLLSVNPSRYRTQ